MLKLTKRAVEALPVPTKDTIHFDGELKGFGVRIAPSGRLTYIAQYRSNGRTRRVKLGVHGPVTAEEARRRARGVLGAVAGGEDPAGAIDAERRSPTVASVADRFVREHVEVRLKATTQHDYKRTIENEVKPTFGPMRICDVTRADVAALHHKLRDRPYQANRALSVLSKMFNLTELWGLRSDGSNPCRHVKKYPEVKRERFLSEAELARLGEVLNALRTEGSESPFVIGAFKLLLLTGCRLSEIQTLRWDYVQPGLITLPDSKTGRRRIPLSDEAWAVLQGLPRTSDNPFVIEGGVPGQYAINLQKPWRRIRKLAGIEDVRIHDLRHSFASIAVMNGMPIATVAKLLGHTQLQTTMRYAHFADEAVRQASAMMGNVVGQALSPRGNSSVLPDGCVIPFPNAAPHDPTAP